MATSPVDGYGRPATDAKRKRPYNEQELDKEIDRLHVEACEELDRDDYRDEALENLDMEDEE